MNIDKEILKAAIDKWGRDAQLEMVEEECTELTLALKKAKRSITHQTIENVIDEIADVNIMIAQANMIFDPVQIQERIDFKLNRLKTRISIS